MIKTRRAWLLLTVFLISVFTINLDDAMGQEMLWVKQFGTSKDDVPADVDFDGERISMAGHTFGALSGFTNLGASDGFIQVTDQDGNVVWTKQFGIRGDDYPAGITVDSSGIYVGGYTTGAFSGQTNSGGQDAFVVKMDGNGNIVWSRQFGTSGDDFIRKVKTGGSIYVVGATGGALSGQRSAGGKDAFIRKLDSDGKEVWTKQFGTSGDDDALGVAVDSSGSYVYVAGYVTGALTGQTAKGGTDAFAVEVNANDGSLSSTYQFGTPEDDAAGAAAWAKVAMILYGDTYGLLGASTLGGMDTYVATMRFSSMISFDFDLLVEPRIVNMTDGTKIDVEVIVKLVRGEPKPVSLRTILTVPQGISISFEPQVVTPTAVGTRAVMKIEASGAGEVSDAITIQGDAEGVSKTFTFNLRVKKPFVFDLSVIPQSSTVTATEPTSILASVAVELVSGEPKLVSFSAPNPPPWVGVYFRPDSYLPPGKVEMEVLVTALAPVGTHTIEIIGTGGGATDTTTFTLVVKPAFDFSIRVSRESLNLTSGTADVLTVYVDLVSGEPGPVTLSLSPVPASGALPSDVTFRFSSPYVTPSDVRILTVAVSEGAAADVDTIEIVGVGGGVTHTARFTLTVHHPLPFDFRLRVTPDSGSLGLDSQTVTFRVSVELLTRETRSVLVQIFAPAGVVSQPTSNLVTPTDDYPASLTIGWRYNPGTHTLTIRGVGGGVGRTTTFTLTLGDARHETHRVTVDGREFTVYWLTDSTISNFAFDQLQKQVSFDAKTNPRTGKSVVTFERALLGEPYTVLVDGQEVKVSDTGNKTHATLPISYPEGAHNIRIIGTTVIPEFPSGVVGLLAAMLATSLILALLPRFRKAAGETAAGSWLRSRAFEPVCRNLRLTFRRGAAAPS